MAPTRGWGHDGGGGEGGLGTSQLSTTGGSKSGDRDSNLIIAQNDGNLALDQKQIGVTYVINCTLFISFWQFLLFVLGKSSLNYSQNDLNLHC